MYGVGDMKQWYALVWWVVLCMVCVELRNGSLVTERYSNRPLCGLTSVVMDIHANITFLTRFDSLKETPPTKLAIDQMEGIQGTQSS